MIGDDTGFRKDGEVDIRYRLKKAHNVDMLDVAPLEEPKLNKRKVEEGPSKGAPLDGSVFNRLGGKTNDVVEEASVFGRLGPKMPALDRVELIEDEPVVYRRRVKSKIVAKDEAEQAKDTKKNDSN